VNCPFRDQFNAHRTLRPIALQWIYLTQETLFGWIKAFGGLRQFKLRGTEKVGAVFGLHVIAYNLIRLGNILKPAMVVA
jgi:hypothetical protein